MITDPIILTQRQADMVDAIRDYWTANGFGPSIRDLMDACDISSSSVVSYNLHRLKEMGLVTFREEVARSVRLKESA